MLFSEEELNRFFVQLFREIEQTAKAVNCDQTMLQQLVGETISSLSLPPDLQKQLLHEVRGRFEFYLKSEDSAFSWKQWKDVSRLILESDEPMESTQLRRLAIHTKLPSDVMQSLLERKNKDAKTPGEIHHFLDSFGLCPKSGMLSGPFFQELFFFLHLFENILNRASDDSTQEQEEVMVHTFRFLGISDYFFKNGGFENVDADMYYRIVASILFEVAKFLSLGHGTENKILISRLYSSMCVLLGRVDKYMVELFLHFSKTALCTDIVMKLASDILTVDMEAAVANGIYEELMKALEYGVELSSRRGDTLMEQQFNSNIEKLGSIHQNHEMEVDNYRRDIDEEGGGEKAGVEKDDGLGEIEQLLAQFGDLED